MSTFLAPILVALSFGALAQPDPAQESPKWFVLRDNAIGTCWTALLIRIDGTYPHGFAQTAGGPYDTEDQALERRRALQETGTCAQ